MTEQRRWPNVLAGAVTVHDKHFLLLKRSDRESFMPNAWGIPAGQLLQGEDPKVACIRELFEETGLRGQVVALTGYSTFASKLNGVELHNIQLNFLVRVDDCKVRLNPSSHSDSKWLPLDDDGDLVDGFTRKILDTAREYCRYARVPRLTHR